MKVSEVTTSIVADYLRLDNPGEIEISEIDAMMDAAKNYIQSYTGLDNEQIDDHEDITQAFFLLVADMFENRNLYMDGKSANVNRAVNCILGLYSVNLL